MTRSVAIAMVVHAALVSFALHVARIAESVYASDFLPPISTKETILLSKMSPQRLKKQQHSQLCNKAATLIVWEEEEEEVNKSTVNDEAFLQNKRQLFSFGKQMMYNTDHKNGDEHQVSTEPHQLRTDEWKIQLQSRPWQSIFRSSSIPKSTTWYVEFHNNGYFRIKKNFPPTDLKKKKKNYSSICFNGGFVSSIGTWEVLSCGRVKWSLPYVTAERNNKGNKNNIKTISYGELEFFADLHPNPFGLQPKLTRGLVVLSLRSNNNYNRRQLHRNNWFRPIIATFSAEGIGIDSADFSYQSRNSKR